MTVEDHVCPRRISTIDRGWAAANMLTNPALDPESKIPEYKFAAVRVATSDQAAP